MGLKDKFIKCKEVQDALDLSLSMGMNLVLYGKGGHGKSEMVEYYYQLENIEPYIKVLGQGTVIEDILGGIDLKELRDSGDIKYNVENSFMNYEHVVFEEGFDAPLQVLEQLKDILSSGKFRNGSQVFEIKTKTIVICTNRSKDEISEDDSIRALMERFQLTLNVKWDSYESSDYNDLFKKVLQKDNPTFAHLIAEISKRSFISPRTAIVSYKIYESMGINGLYYMGINKNILKSLEKEEKVAKEINAQTNYLKSCDNVLEGILASTNRTSNDYIRVIKLKKQIEEQPFHDSVFNRRNSVLSHCDDVLKKVLKSI